MKKNKQLLIISILILFCMPLTAQTADGEENKVYAPFISRIKVEARGTGILLTWQDSRSLRNPEYHIYASDRAIDPESFLFTNRIASVGSGEESFLYEPGDSEPRFFIILAEEEGKVFDVFIPYRNMSMQSVSAEKIVLQEEKAARIGSLLVVPEVQDLLITASSSDLSRPVILFRSTEPLINREDLAKATQVHVFVNEILELKDHVVPGIPFYYALVDQSLYESGSLVLLYDGSVTLEPVTIPLEEWSLDSAHTFQFASRHIPLPLLNVELDIEYGDRLPDPGIPDELIDLSSETELALAGLNLAKSVKSPVWKQPQILPVDRISEAAPETAWVVDLIEQGNWTAVKLKSEEQLKSTFDTEVRSRLHFYKAQAHYFSGNLEYAFMDFLSSRRSYYSESNSWLFSIYEQRRKRSKSLNLE